MRWESARLSLLVLVLAAAFAVSGCGKKTRPVPPDTVLPAPITDLTYHLDEKGVSLSWSYPGRTVQGERLPYRIEGFQLLRAVIPLADYCKDCPIPFGPPIEIKGESGDEGKVFYQETLLRPRNRYVYQVRSKAGWFVTSDESNTVSVVWDTPLMAPREFAIEEGDRQLRLSWQPPTGLLDGTTVSDPILYQVYRSASGEAFGEIGAPVDGLFFVDTNLRNGRPYYYKVRAIRLHEDTRAAGMASDILLATPQDRVAPAPPRQMTAVVTAAGVKLIWEAVPESDLAGFRIYRRPARKLEPELIAEVGGAGLSYVDTKLPRGKGIWYYSVSAFDRSRPANESDRSRETLLEVSE
ncbi:fibronectin type III domain-containing protein [Thiovibrio sp. JS02]